MIINYITVFCKFSEKVAYVLAQSSISPPQGLYRCRPGYGVPIFRLQSPGEISQSIAVVSPTFNPLTAGAAYIRFFTVLLAHYISAFKPVKDKK